MEYRRIGKWGIKVSEISLGSWLTYGQSVNETESAKQIDYAFHNGINFFDTANVYGQGSGEQAVGKALNKLCRDSYVLATKVFFPMADGPNDRGLSRKHIFEQCHASLKRLQTDYIDIYQCHRFDRNVQVYEIVRSMDDLARQGKILYWGVSEWSAEQIENAVKVAEEINALPPISNQPKYNMLERQIEESVLPTSKKLGLGQVVFSPLAQGILTGKYKAGEPIPENSRAADERVSGFIQGSLTRENLLIVEQLKLIAAELHITMPQLALAWCLRYPEISSTIIGATSIAHIDDNKKASGIKIPAEVLANIDDILNNKVTNS
jgi:voltage-dependent potassium channel beta subunit